MVLAPALQASNCDRLADAAKRWGAKRKTARCRETHRNRPDRIGRSAIELLRHASKRFDAR